MKRKNRLESSEADYEMIREKGSNIQVSPFGSFERKQVTPKTLISIKSRATLNELNEMAARSTSKDKTLKETSLRVALKENEHAIGFSQPKLQKNSSKFGDDHKH